MKSLLDQIFPSRVVSRGSSRADLGSITMMDRDQPRPWLKAFAVATAGVAAIVLTLTASHAIAADASQQVFPSAEAAVAALAQAAKTDDAAAARQILGPDAKKVIASGDRVADRNAALQFYNNYQQMHRLAYNSQDQVILYLGAENWPFPIPLVKKGWGWVFDTAAGEQEILYRRIGTNELFTIATLRELADAETEYRNANQQFAARILSDKGTHNGLFWPASAGQPPSPIGPLVASAAAEGYKRSAAGQPTPFHGYIYKVLTSQGKDAPGGARSYEVEGKLTGGFAILAYPAEYRSSGVMTFLVNQNGTVVQKDLGPDTDKLAASMTEYNPDKSWLEVKEDSEQ
jgi:hypothetical protein